MEENSSLELCYWLNMGSDQVKFERNLIFQGIRLRFLCSLDRAIQCESNNLKINRLHKERPLSSLTLKILRDLLLHSLGPELDVVAVPK